MKWLLVTALVLFCGEAAAQLTPVPVPVQPATRTFEPQHLYYMSPTGDDANNGLTTVTNVVNTPVASDNFNRANGALGSNWIDSPGIGGLAVLSNAVNATGGASMVSYWNPATNTFPADQYAEVTLLGTTGTFGGPVVRHQAGSSSFYIGLIDNSGGNGIRIFRRDSGTYNLIASAADTWVSGDVLRLTAVGSILQLSHNGVVKLTVTDTTYPTGQPGIFVNNGVGADDWSAGTTVREGPWATPNHPTVCGDVTLVQPGNYATAQFGANYQEPTACPSTDKGIDGQGGIHFSIFLCAGSDLGGGVGVGNGCNITTQGFGDPATLVNFGNAVGPGVARNPVSHLAISGMHLDAGNTTFLQDGSCCRGIELGRACGEGSGPPQQSHHIAVLNTMITNVRQGMTFGPNNCGDAGVAFDRGSDYVAAVGLIVRNATQENFGGFVCIAAIDLIGTNNHDTLPGTHFYAYNNYGMNNHNASCEPQTGTVSSNNYDVEFIMIDSPGVGNTTGQHVLANNIGFNSGRSCIQMTQNGNVVLLPIKVFNNSCYGNFMIGFPSPDLFLAELVIQQSSDLWQVSIYNNIFRPDGFITNAQGTLPKFAMLIATSNSPATGLPNYKQGTQVGAGKENILYTPTTGCAFNCLPSNSGPSIVSYTGNVFPTPTTVGTTTDFYVDPLFANTADLSNHYGTPNCTGFETTTQCMGWDAASRTMTPSTVIADFVASCAQCGGKGFQPPSTTCGGPVTEDYPDWLKGVNYLHWNGTIIQQKSGLATRPCNL